MVGGVLLRRRLSTLGRLTGLLGGGLRLAGCLSLLGGLAGGGLAVRAGLGHLLRGF